MRISISVNEQELGKAAAEKIANALNRAIAQKGEANLLVSTGASQFTTLAELIQKEVDWPRVTVFHLDEYVGLPETHPASFRKYLRERLASKLPFRAVQYISGEGNVLESVREISEEIAAHPIDVGIVGIGENAHIAFNDPPADFFTQAAYHVVTLNDSCKRQQVGEGWFASADEVPKQAISMTPAQIMRCACVVSPVPGRRKAKAVYDMLAAKTPDPNVPATLLKKHPEWTLFLDEGSVSQCDMGRACLRYDTP